MPIVRTKEVAPAPRRRSRAIVWALLGVGVALLAAGGIAYALGAFHTPPPPPPPPPMAAPIDAGVIDAGAEIAVEEPPEEVAPARRCPERSGRWSGQWAALTERGTWAGELHETVAENGQAELHGDIRVTGSSCGSGGHLVGRIQDDCSVAFDPQRAGPCRVVYSATFDGDNLRGELRATAFGMREEGWWVGTREATAAP